MLPHAFARSQAALLARFRAATRASVTPPQLGIPAPIASSAASARPLVPAIPIHFLVVDMFRLLVSPAERDGDAHDRVAAVASHDGHVCAADRQCRARPDQHAARGATLAVLVA